jgi:hypothetical protein
VRAEVIVIRSNFSPNRLVCLVNTQQEFWRREYKSEIIEKDGLYQDVLAKLIHDGVCPVFQIDNDPIELEYLSSLPPNSLIVWCHSDERYDIGFNRNISQITSIRAVLRPYRLFDFKFTDLLNSILKTVLNIKYAKNFVFSLRVILWQVRGFSMAFRQYRISRLFKKSHKNYINMLIGYTNVFAISLLVSEDKYNFSQNESLFEIVARTPNTFGEKELTFSGQVGQVVRETAIRAATTIPGSFIIRRNSYGASNVLVEDVRKKGLEYIHALNDSKFVLCPPGNISGESFRIFETVLLRRIPIVMDHVTSDPLYSSPIVHRGPWQSHKTWGGLSKSALKTPTNELLELAELNFSDFHVGVQKTRVKLEAIANSQET